MSTRTPNVAIGRSALTLLGGTTNFADEDTRKTVALGARAAASKTRPSIRGSPTGRKRLLSRALPILKRIFTGSGRLSGLYRCLSQINSTGLANAVGKPFILSDNRVLPPQFALARSQRIQKSHAFRGVCLYPIARQSLIEEPSDA